MQATELHLHTWDSLLDGLNNADEYMERAAEIGMTHLAITDHGTLTGHREFQRAAQKHNITPILGCEMYISATDRFDRRAKAKRTDGTKAFNHLIVLAQNANGLKNLNKLSEIAWTEGFYNKPRIDMGVLEEYSDDLIVLSGCIGGLIAHAIENNMPTMANNYAAQFKDIFGERFFMELQGHNAPEMNQALLAIAREHGIAPVVTSDCHYAREEDLWKEEAMLILSTGPKAIKGFDFSKSQSMEYLERFNYIYPDRTMTFQEFEIFLRSAQQHYDLLVGQIGEDATNEAIANTMVVANSIGEYPYHEGLDLLPRPEGDPKQMLRDAVIEGAKKRGTFGKPEYDERREEELSIISGKDFDTYFLIEAGVIQRGKDKGILFGPGRGSGAGSLVNYELYVTEVDPIVHNLLFFRFINPERNDYPDIDTDVEDSRRAEVKEDLLREYTHVASIATFGMWRGKKAVRDAARVFRVPLGDVNKALKGADWPEPQMDWFEMWEGTEKGQRFRGRYPEVVRLAKWMHGRKREQGMHAGGIVVSKEPVANHAPIQSASDTTNESGPRIPLVAYDMDTAAEIGFIKYDFLGLKALTIISDTIEMIKKRHGVQIVPTEIPLDDKRVYRTLSEGFTQGVFQCEATPYTHLIIGMGGVANFDELVASNALVRPGAMKSSAGAAFIKRKHGDEMIEYPHKDMHWFTKETYGVVIYQEQVMLTMTELAGMKMSDADKVRKIIGKKRDVKEFEEYKEKFVSGASEKVDPEVAEGLWHDFEAHAGYSFNKSHAVAYSMLSVWTAWLKEYYPLEFMTAVLRNEGDKDKLLEYLIETKRMGIRVLLPNVNKSGVRFEIQEDEKGEYIRFGLSNIKFISGKIANRLVSHQPFASYQQLADIVMAKGSGLNSRVLQSLNQIGGATFPDNPKRGDERDHFFEYLNIPAFKTQDIHPKIRAQLRPLDEYSENEAFVSMGMVRGIKTGPGWARIDIVDETGTAGVFASEHNAIEQGQLYVFLISNNRVARYIKVSDLLDGLGGGFQTFLESITLPDLPEDKLLVVSFTSRVTKAGNKMGDVVLSDKNKELYPAMVFPQMFMRGYTKLRPGAVVDVELKETQDGGIFVDRINR